MFVLFKILNYETTRRDSRGSGGGVLSNRFGKATDSFLGSEGVQGKVAGEYFKFIIETGSNAAPNLIEE